MDSTKASKPANKLPEDLIGIKMTDLSQLTQDIHELRKEVAAIRERTPGQKLWDIFFRIAAPLSLLAAGALVTHEVRLSKVEAQQITDVDAVQAHQDILAEARRMDTEVAVRFATELSKLPPVWLLDIVTDLKASNSRILERLTRLETLLEKNGK